MSPRSPHGVSEKVHSNFIFSEILLCAMAALPSTSPQDSQAAQNPKRMTVPRRPLEDDFFEMQIDQFEAQNEQRPADTDRQGMQEAVPDMPTEEELQAMAEEEGLPIEQ
jgi:hypothetical protein